MAKKEEKGWFVEAQKWTQNLHIQNGKHLQFLKHGGRSLQNGIHCD
jgi:hypothetical protein